MSAPDGRAAAAPPASGDASPDVRPPGSAMVGSGWQGPPGSDSSGLLIPGVAAAEVDGSEGGDVDVSDTVETDLGVHGVGFDPGPETPAWIEAGRVEAELDADRVEDVEDEVRARAGGSMLGSVGGFVLSDADVGDEPAPRVSVAGATADPVKDYLNRIGRVSLLSAGQEVDLALRIEAGVLAAEKLSSGAVSDPQLGRDLAWLVEDGARARDQMVEANLRLVVSVAKRYTGRGMGFLDLIQEGNLGLFRAVEKFDYTKGYKFSTYATWWIRQSIHRAMADQSRSIRIPVHLAEAIQQVSRARADLLVDLGREPTAAELAEALDMSTDKVLEVQRYAREPLSLHTKLGEDADSEFGDLIEDTEAVAPSDEVSLRLLAQQFEAALAMVSEREAAVMRMWFGLVDGEPKTLEYIGRVQGVTRERIRQIEHKALSKLRHPTRQHGLRDFL